VRHTWCRPRPRLGVVSRPKGFFLLQHFSMISPVLEYYRDGVGGPSKVSCRQGVASAGYSHVQKERSPSCADAIRTRASAHHQWPGMAGTSSCSGMRRGQTPPPPLPARDQSYGVCHHRCTCPPPSKTQCRGALPRPQRALGKSAVRAHFRRPENGHLTTTCAQTWCPESGRTFRSSE